ncbi:hypothetical protein GCM10011495_35890 [Hymenobacter frigidus]|uniref:DUF202 domain-containing protein n=1 Tax=Hymenobacter frigidus TaxID=1524095 RepID=A0ABQ2AHU3_9BACT|nr:DUF202 domain-containing protein [Hymenobacter frigidus]GGH90311.1 hypothetical protein GCM10011495_35890 [Hymenobacter frigidus]
MTDPPSLSDRLALQRTSLAMLGLGLALIQLYPVRAGMLGYGAVGAAALVMLTGWLRFHQRRKEIEVC